MTALSLRATLRRPAAKTNANWLAIASLASIGIAIVAATILTDGKLVAALAPVAVTGVVLALWRLPLRVTLLGLIFLCLALDNNERVLWSSPLASLGALLVWNLNKTIPVEELVIPGMTLLLVFALIVHLHRTLTRSPIDTQDEFVMTRLLPWSLTISALAVVWMIAEGIFRFGNPQMAKIQVQYFFHLLLIAYLLAVSLRGTRDYRTLARVILLAVCAKASMVIWIWYSVPTPIIELGSRTAHGDSLLFAVAVVMLVVLFAEQPTRRNGIRLLAFVPWILTAVVMNNRRIAWVEIAASLLAYVIISRRSHFKVLILRAMVIALPVVAMYTVVGWNSDSSLFAPVHLFRSVSDGEVDGSTMYRDIEDYNLLATIRENPVFGTGFGHPYLTAVANADISFFKEYLFLPHNMILGLYAFGGMFGFAGLSAAIVIGIFQSTRRYFHAALAPDRVASFTAFAMMLIYLVHCWGDIGFNEMRSIYLVGPALAIAGQRHRSGSRLRHGEAQVRQPSLSPTEH